MEEKKAVIRIGTSNIVVPGNRQHYPEDFREASRLRYYSSIFNTLEINSSFYKIPMPLTFEKWALDVPDNFSFSVKLFKEITHVKKLEFDTASLDKFIKAAARLGKKKGCILVQFPGKITLDYFNQVEQIIKRLTTKNDDFNIAVEFRSPTWYTGETYELMDTYGTSIVLHDIPKSKNFQLNKKASFAYRRYHGPTGNYRGSYTDEFLQQEAAQMQDWLSSGKDVYAYFNNTIGSAFENAVTLRQLVEKSS